LARLRLGVPRDTWLVGQMVQRLIVGFAVAALALVVGLAASGLLIDVTGGPVDSRAAVQHVVFGFPVTAISQDQSAHPPSTYPSQTGVESPWENPTDVHMPGLLVDAGVAAGVVFLGLFGTTMSVAAGIRRFRLRRTAIA